MVANAEDFFQRRNSLKCFIDTIFQQSFHPQDTRLAADFLGRCSVERHFPDAGTHAEHLENAEPTTIAGVVAVIAPATSHEAGVGSLVGSNPGRPKLARRRVVRLLTFRTGYPNQPLSHDGHNAASDEEWLDAYIGESCNSTRRIVRM